jgi:probable HAF family extracellular repeat protein
MRTAAIINFVLLPFKKFRPAYSLGALVATTVGWISIADAFGQTNAYIVTELSRGDSGEVPSKLNNLGDFAGRLAGAAEHGTRAAIWDHSGFKAKHLGALSGGEYSSASGINDAGQVAGVSNTSKAILPFAWTTTGGLRRVPLLPGDNCGQATAINKYGHIVGYSSGPNGAKACLWKGGTVRQLSTLSGGSYSSARAVNNSDEVVGVSGSSDGERAVLWTKSGEVRDLGTLPGDSSSEAMAINNVGDVVGYSKGPSGMRAFLWTEGGGMEELGILPGGNSSRALDINDSGVVVGSSTSSSGDHAFVWTRQTGIVDLNGADALNLGMVFIEADAINSKGKILVMGRNAEEADMHSATAHGAGEYCAPVPPSTFLLTPTNAP